jgi:hypothetical protein
VKPAATNVASLTVSNPTPALAITNLPATNVAVEVPAPVTVPPTTSAVPEPVAVPVPAMPAAAVEPASVPPPVATPVEYPGGRQRLSWGVITLSLLGVVLLAAGGWLLVRPRPRSGKSLITSSLDREQRP